MSRDDGRPWWANSETQAARVRRNSRGLAFAAVGVLVLAGLVAFAAADPGRQVRVLESGGVQQPPTLAAMAAGCSGIIIRAGAGSRVLGLSPIAKTKDPRIAEPVSSLSPKEARALLGQGWMIIWFDAQRLPDQNVSAAYGTFGDGSFKAHVSPWPTERQWPVKSPWIISSWDGAQSCDELSPVVVEEFAAETGTKAQPRR